jgi:hypothetical protein
MNEERRSIEYITYECEKCAHDNKWHTSACVMKAVKRTASWADITGVEVRGGPTYKLAKAQ